MPPEKHHRQPQPAERIRQHLESAFKFPASSPPSGSSPSAKDPPSLPPPEPPEQSPAALTIGPEQTPAPNPHPDEASQIAAALREKLGEKSYRHCFADKTRFRVEQDEAIIGVGSPFLLSWMQKQFRAITAEAARSVLGPSARVRFEVDGQLAAELHRQDGNQTSQPTMDKSTHAAQASTANPARKSPSQDGTYRAGRQFSRLDDFIAGESTVLAMTAVHEVCQSPGGQYNPLYLHGGVGVGKTHLLEGVYRQIRSRHPALRVLYLTAEAFTNYFTVALREKTLPGFRQRFRNLQVLLVDDLDFLDNKRGIQEEFLHTFKQLESQGGQIVLAADRHPRLLSNLSEDLMTRFLSGLVCRLEVPDQAPRRQIAAAHALRQKANFGEGVLEFIAGRFSRNVRELQGAVNTLATYGRMTKRRVSLSAARRVLADLERDCTRIIRMSDVEQTVCQFFGVTPNDLKSAKRIRSLTQPRMLAMFLIRKHTQAAYQEIGQYFGGRNHATVISAEKKVLGWLSDKSPVKINAETWPVDEVIEALERQLQAG